MIGANGVALVLLGSCGVLACEPEEEESDVGSPFVDRPRSPLSLDARAHIEQLLSHMNLNGNGSVTVEEATAFVNHELLNAHGRGFFIDVDSRNSRLEMSDFLQSFEGLKRRGYSDEDIVTSCESIIENGTWRSWRSNCSNRQFLDIPAWAFEASDATEIVPPCSAATPAPLAPACSAGLSHSHEVHSQVHCSGLITAALRNAYRVISWARRCAR
jgi:hypothetical protein